MTLEQQDEMSNVPNVTAQKEKAPCLETIYKRLEECNGSIKALFYDLDYVTRTTAPTPSEDVVDPKSDTPTPNLLMMQTEVDILRNKIRDCKKKLDKARWG